MDTLTNLANSWNKPKSPTPTPTGNPYDLSGGNLLSPPPVAQPTYDNSLIGGQSQVTPRNPFIGTPNNPPPAPPIGTVKKVTQADGSSTEWHPIETQGANQDVQQPTPTQSSWDINNSGYSNPTGTQTTDPATLARIQAQSGPNGTNPNAVPFNAPATNITSDHLNGDTTPSTVLNNVNQYQGNMNALNAVQNPLFTAYSNAQTYGPDQTTAMQNVLTQNQIGRQMQQNYLGGVNNILGRAQPLDDQQGQLGALQRQDALIEGQQGLNTQSAVENANYLETLRQNKMQGIQSQIGFNQNQYQNQFGATQAGLNYGLSEQGIALQQQGVDLNKYQYTTVPDPSNPSLQVIQVIDKTTGKVTGSISAQSPQGQTVLSTGQVTGSPQNTIANAFASVESSGNYQANNTSSGALGKYQIVPKDWFASIGLDPNSDADKQKFLNDPVLQDQTFSGIMQTLYKQQGGDMKKAIGAYFGGQAGADAYGTPKGDKMTDGNMSVNDYVNKVYSKMQADTNLASQPQQYTYDQISKVAPSNISNAIMPLPDGSAYIDATRLANPNLAYTAQAFANQAGIKVLNGSEVTGMQSGYQAIQNLKNLAQMFGQLAPDGALARAGNTATNWASKLFDTEYGQKLDTYASNQDSLFQSIKTLAGSSPRLSNTELNITKNSVPQLTGGSKDTLADGARKLALTGSYLDNSIRTIDPNYVGTAIPYNGQFIAQLSDGQMHAYPDEATAQKALTLDVKNR